jgi:hypothetical protein
MSATTTARGTAGTRPLISLPCAILALCLAAGVACGPRPAGGPAVETIAPGVLKVAVSSRTV